MKQSLKMSDPNYGIAMNGNFENQVVSERLKQIGQFNYLQADGQGLRKDLEFRQEQIISDKCKYEGQWIIGEKTREGRGK